MTHSQFMRVARIAGGVSCTSKQFIQASHTLLSLEGRSHKQRVLRHKWLREGLRLLKLGQDLTT